MRAKFEEDVQEDLMEKMTLGEFKARFGENRAIASLAVIVEDEEKDKKRINPWRHPWSPSQSPDKVPG